MEVSAEAEVDTVAFGQLQGGTAGHMLDAIVPALFVDVTDLIFVLVEDHASIVVVRNASRGETEVVDTVNGSGENACVREEIENKHTHTHTHTHTQIPTAIKHKQTQKQTQKATTNINKHKKQPQTHTHSNHANTNTHYFINYLRENL